MSATVVTDRLTELSEDYTYRLNMLLDEGREDLAVKLAAQYEREALQLLSRPAVQGAG